MLPLPKKLVASSRKLIASSRKLAAEAIGTYVLVFAGTGAIIVNEVSGGAVTHVGVALTFGLVVFAMIAALGDVSGAHLNPAVTVGFALARRLDWRFVGPYVASQLLGAMAASVTLRLLFPAAPNLGITQPVGPAMQTMALEVLLTAALMFVILGVTSGAKEKGLTAGLAIGATVGLESLFAGPITGASMNPARSLGPAIMSGQIAWLWIYLVAPPLGAALAVLGCRCVRESGCCCGPSVFAQEAARP